MIWQRFRSDLASGIVIYTFRSLFLSERENIVFSFNFFEKYSFRQFAMIFLKILLFNSLVRGEKDPKETFETVKINSGLHVGQGYSK